jgi:hypothetical protein
VLVDDHGAAHGDHHQDAQQAAEDTDQHDSGDFQVEAEDQDGGHGHAQAEGQRFAGRTGRLRDAVFQDRRILAAHLLGQAEQGDGDHGDGNRGADGQAHLQHQVERGGAEDHPQDDAHEQGAEGHFGQFRVGRDIRLHGARCCIFCHTKFLSLVK